MLEKLFTGIIKASTAIIMAGAATVTVLGTKLLYDEYKEAKEVK